MKKNWENGLNGKMESSCGSGCVGVSSSCRPAAGNAEHQSGPAFLNFSPPKVQLELELKPDSGLFARAGY